jgi:hypothetical protein
MRCTEQLIHSGYGGHRCYYRDSTGGRPSATIVRRYRARCCSCTGRDGERHDARSDEQTRENFHVMPSSFQLDKLNWSAVVAAPVDGTALVVGVIDDIDRMAGQYCTCRKSKNASCTIVIGV